MRQPRGQWQFVVLDPAPPVFRTDCMIQGNALAKNPGREVTGANRHFAKFDGPNQSQPINPIKESVNELTGADGSL
jgi:hypothetical protein